MNGIFFTVEIMCFICDAPACAFIKNTSGCNAYFGCERCIQKGVRIDTNTIFPSVAALKLSDETSRSQNQPEHRNGKTPLLKIQRFIDMIHQFSLDFMHLCCLGVVKKLLEYWLTYLIPIYT